MDYIYIGKIVNTHGIKGEIRLISNFDKKERVLIIDFPIYIGNQKDFFTIKSYRKHKNYDMITLSGLNNINEVLKYKGCKVYIKRKDLHLNENEYILDDLLDMKVISKSQEYGKIKDIYDNNNHILLAVSYKKDYYIPYHEKYIKRVDLKNKTIEVLNVEDLII